MTRTFAGHLHSTEIAFISSFASTELSLLFSGGEGGIRTHDRLALSATCRFFIAADSTLATNAVDHCPVLPAGKFPCPVPHVPHGSSNFSLGSLRMRLLSSR
jgi:hypothetical protein